MTDTKTLDMIQIAVFSAVITICSWVTIPLPFSLVPITLGTLGAALAGTVLGPVKGPASVMVFLALGAVGIPVFHGFTGGLGVIAGPTGGYLIGYITIALITGMLTKEKDGRFSSVTMIAIASVIGILSCYVLGTAYYMFLTHTGFTSALMLCVIPFLPGDALKVAAVCLLTERLRRAVIR